jgi:hypothetical protein
VLPWRARPVGLEGDLGHFALLAHFEAISSAPSGAAMQQDHVGMLGMNLVETIPDEVVVVEVEPSGERDLRP